MPTDAQWREAVLALAEEYAQLGAQVPRSMDDLDSSVGMVHGTYVADELRALVARFDPRPSAP